MLNKVTHALLFFFLGFSVTAQAFDEKGNIELSDHMHALQYYLHKTGLALDDQNQPLTSYYLRKMEQKTTMIERFGSTVYPNLTASAQHDFRPPLQRMRRILGNAEWDMISNAYDEVVAGCNACHASSNVEFIRIRRFHENLFMQNFALEKTRIINKRSPEAALLHGTPSLPVYTQPQQAPVMPETMVAEQHYAADRSLTGEGMVEISAEEVMFQEFVE